jgi:rhodanese-related sulfurtransferase
MSAETISARKAAGLIASGEAVLVDIREADERARSHIPGSAHAPASRLGSAALGVAPGSTVIFHCQSGSRTAQNAGALAAAAPGCRVLVVEGGMAALRAAGVPVSEDKRAPMPIMRQVQITPCWARWWTRAFMRFPLLSARVWFSRASWGFAPWRISWR